MTVLETRRVAKCRKPFACDGCGRRFEAGQPKERQRIIGEDGPYTWQSCPTCMGIVRDLCALDSDYLHDGVPEDHIHEDMMRRFGSWEEADKHFAGRAGTSSDKGGEGQGA